MRESMSNIEVRKINKKNIVDVLIAEGSLTKAEITQKAGLSLATVNVLLRELLEEHIVEQGEVLQSTGGRRPTLYKVVDDYRVAVGVAVSEHHIRLSYVNWSCGVKDVLSYPVIFENTDEYWQLLRKLVTDFLNTNKLKEEKLYGMGIAVPARIISLGRIEDIEPLGIFAGIDFQKVKSMYNCKVLITEAIKAAGFSHTGSIKHKKSCVYIHISEDVGGAVISNGDFGGMSNRTASLADVYLSPDYLSEEDISGERVVDRVGTFGKSCSRTALLGEEFESLEEFFGILDEGRSELAAKRWERYIRNLAWMVHTMRVIYDVDIIIGGEVSSFVEERKDRLFELLQNNDIYGEKMDYVEFSVAKEYDCCIGTGFLVLVKLEEFLDTCESLEETT
jgi:predicted NBD/HSP70 family sugar kinase